jgi:squalene-hopene/tetraprenyl-beta-curcumene cyclase
MTPPELFRLQRAYETARAALLAERTPEGHWVGELSTSALSTAVAVSALAMVQRRSLQHEGVGARNRVAGAESKPREYAPHNQGPIRESALTGASRTQPQPHDQALPGAREFEALIAGGLDWLAAHQNDDGGWGDTVRSFSNISTTLLCRGAFHLAGAAGRFAEPLRRSEAWLIEHHGKTPAEVAEAVRRRYGKDRTFSVPILMTCALAGLVEWREVPNLPFELACLPAAGYRWLGLPVVSYALPALIAIGQAVYHHRRPRNPLARLVRRASIGRSLRVLSRIQPSNGGFLEAAPLTGFVALGLASTGRADHPVVRKCVEFLVASVRPDGSWPIDTNLSTWVTTLAVNALARAGDLDALDRKEYLLAWLLSQQYRERHPYTGADPGAWAWTPLPGGVPDADDTPGALLALAHLGGTKLDEALIQGLDWLRDLQNGDGGWPTFCRGWGKLPFDRSGSDLTAHALRALRHWQNGDQDIDRVFDRGLAYLAREQRPDGSWLPLWFGNQHASDDVNPTYGTARVLTAYRDLEELTSEPARKGIAYLVATQNADGGWGGAAGTPSSVEETALAVDALLDAPPDVAGPAVARGLTWLVEAVEQGRLAEATPIGFYFAKLWYFETLYPLVFTVAALGRARTK